MRDKLLDDLTCAMKAQDKETLAVLRMAKGAIQLEEINKHHPLTDEEFIDIIGKQIKTRKESVLEFTKANRLDLVTKTESEIKILSKYMPKQLSEEEIFEIIDEAFLSINPKSQSDMGKIMGYITPKLKGKADMSFVSKTIKDKLINL